LIIERTETWGKIKYDTSQHRFSYVNNNRPNAVAYARLPVLLNVDVTMRCNMNCLHCLAKDFNKKEDLEISNKLLDWINESPFMVIVLTGGEPLLPEYETKVLTLLRKIHNKGLIIDTNGTFFPSFTLLKTILEKNVLIRVSWDSVRPQDEIYLRRVKPNAKLNDRINLEYYYRKLNILERLENAGIKVAVQSVIHKWNMQSIENMPKALHAFSICQWYLQRFIPSFNYSDWKYEVSKSKYNEITTKLSKICHEYNITCVTKKDRRHNCVFLLIGKGVLYTQSENPGQKIRLGTIDSEISWFDYVSSADHMERYYYRVLECDV